MAATIDRDASASEAARRARLRRLASLTPGERLARLDALNRQLSRLRKDAGRRRAVS
jgi:hypothetical protein